MKTRHYASISANGNILLAEEDSHKIPKDVLADFMQLVIKTGNMVIGRKTFELLLRNPAAKEGFKDIHIVVLSKHLIDGDGFTVCDSPADAFAYLEQMHFDTMLVAGGMHTYNSFIGSGLIDELYLNINPLITGSGGNLVHQETLTIDLSLSSSRQLTSQIVQLHYMVSSAD